MKKSLILAMATVATFLATGSRSEAALTVSLTVNAVTAATNTGTNSASIVNATGGPLAPAGSFSASATDNAGQPGVAIMNGSFSLSYFNQTGSAATLVVTFTENAYNLANFPGGQPGNPYGYVSTTITNTGSPTGFTSATLVTTASAATSNSTNTISAASTGSTYTTTPFTSSAGNWSTTTTITYTVASNAFLSVSGFQFNNVAATPAPSALLLAGFGLPLFGFMRRGFRARKPTFAA